MNSTDAITPNGLLVLGMLHGNGNEYAVRIRGGTDDGRKSSPDEDVDGDEVANLIVTRTEDRSGWEAHVEVYEISCGNTTESISLGRRETIGEIVELLRSLKAWGCGT